MHTDGREAMTIRRHLCVPAVSVSIRTAIHERFVFLREFFAAKERKELKEEGFPLCALCVLSRPSALVAALPRWVHSWFRLLSLTAASPRGVGPSGSLIVRRRACWLSGDQITSAPGARRELLDLVEESLHVVAGLDLLRLAEEFDGLGVLAVLHQQLGVLHQRPRLEPFDLGRRIVT